MNNIELIGKGNLVSQIPWSYEDRRLSSEAASNIILLKVEYDKAINNFRNETYDILNSLKSEEFLKKEQLINDMKIIEEKNNSDNLTDNEIKTLEQAKAIQQEYLKEKEEIEEIYNKSYKKKLLEEVNFNKGLNKADWKELYEMLSDLDTISFKYPNGETKDIKVSLFLQFIVELIIE